MDNYLFFAVYPVYLEEFASSNSIGPIGANKTAVCSEKEQERI